mmetsp:Transcript_27588/g.65466  ORF Transcript_27588/g.65466 Transcript_27588/m.65466 type:complete len:265 (+) Transcript_27588:380-1174(+)
MGCAVAPVRIPSNVAGSQSCRRQCRTSMPPRKAPGRSGSGPTRRRPSRESHPRAGTGGAAAAHCRQNLHAVLSTTIGNPPQVRRVGPRIPAIQGRTRPAPRFARCGQRSETRRTRPTRCRSSAASATGPKGRRPVAAQAAACSEPRLRRARKPAASADPRRGCPGPRPTKGRGPRARPPDPAGYPSGPPAAVRPPRAWRNSHWRNSQRLPRRLQNRRRRSHWAIPWARRRRGRGSGEAPPLSTAGGRRRRRRLWRLPRRCPRPP